MDDVEKLRYIFDQYSITPHTDLVLANAIVARTDTLLGVSKAFIDLSVYVLTGIQVGHLEQGKPHSRLLD